VGTRLKSVLPDKPKPLALIGNISFLELLVLQLRSQGLRNLVMCTGFQASQIQEKFGNGYKWGVSIDYSEEVNPLGTAGAIKLAERFLKPARDFVVMNGDSFLELDFRQLIQFHEKNDGSGSVAVRRVPDAARYGTVIVSEQNRVVRFSEKMGIAEPGLINGGIYVFDRAVLEAIPDGPSSLENDILPGLLKRGVYAFEQNGMFIDIGTPEDYARAQNLCENLTRAAAPEPCSSSRKRLGH